MTDKLIMIGAGLFFIFFGLFVTDVRGAMPGAKRGYPPPLRFRLILIGFGLLIVAIGTARLFLE